MENLFVFLSALQILVGLYLVYQATKWLSYVRRRAGTDPGFYSPRTAVLCPCKGMEPGLERNLTALCEFDHQNYQVFFFLASVSDPPANLAKRGASQTPGKAHAIFAGPPQNFCEQAHNLRPTLQHLPPDYQTMPFASTHS